MKLQRCWACRRIEEKIRKGKWLSHKIFGLKFSSLVNNLMQKEEKKIMMNSKALSFTTRAFELKKIKDLTKIFER